MALASAVTPLIIVLAVLFGAGVGWLFVLVVRRPSPREQRERELAIAKDTARRTFNETLQTLFGEQPPTRHSE